MRRQLLAAGEIARLDRIYCDAYAEMVEWRRNEPLAALIHLPKLPELLSVSIAALVGPRLIGEELVLGLGRHDLQTHQGAGVGVKGTGPSRWIRVTDVDRAARWLLWVDYTDRIRHGGTVEVLGIDARQLRRTGAGELTRSQLSKRISVMSCAPYEPGHGGPLDA